MKKTVAILLVLSLALAGMATAALATGDAGVAGIWYLDTLEMNGATVRAADMGLSITMTLNEDGTVVLEATGEEPETGTWTLAGDILTIDDGVEQIPFTWADGTLSGTMMGLTMTFTTEQGTGFVPAPGVAATDAAEFDGDWVGVQVYTGGAAFPFEGSGIEMLAVVSAGNVKLVQINADGTEASSEVTCTLTDGVLTGTRNLTGTEETLTLQLHEDGSMSLSVEPTNDGALIFFQNADADQAEPAA